MKKSFLFLTALAAVALVGCKAEGSGDGPQIEWKDTNYDDAPLKRNPRIKVRAYDEQGIPLNDDKGNKQYDDRLWRFTKA